MSITLKKDVWKVKDPSSGNYRGAAILSTTLPEDAAQIVADTEDQLDALTSATQTDINAITANAQTSVNNINNQLNNSSSGIIPQATAAMNGIESQRQTMIDSIASVAGQGTDTTLSQTGVAADAKVTGDQVSNLKSAIIPYNSVDVIAFSTPESRTINGVTFTFNPDKSCTVSGTATAVANAMYFTSPNTLPDWIIPGETYVVKYSGVGVRFQIFTYHNGVMDSQSFLTAFDDAEVIIPADISGIIIRLSVLANTTVNETVHPHMMIGGATNEELTVYNCISTQSWTPSGGSSYGVDYVYNAENNTFTITGTATRISFVNQYYNTSQLPNGVNAGDTLYLYFDTSDPNIAMEVFAYDSNGTQSRIIKANETSIVWIPNNAVGLLVRISVNSGSTVNATVKYDFVSGVPSKLSAIRSFVAHNLGVQKKYTDCDDVDENCFIFVSYTSGSTDVVNTPFAGAGWLETITAPGSNFLFQRYFPYSLESNNIWIRVNTGTTWNNWKEIGSGATYEITQNINRDEYNNTYNITTTPTITTDSNGWLAPVDTAETPQSSATDMTPAIMSLLNSTGHCHLAPGVFYVSGGINMPAQSSLVGCGKNTIVKLLDSVSSGYVVQPTTECTISDIMFSGGDSAPANVGIADASDLGSRHGVYCVANYDGSTSHTTLTTHRNLLTNCYFVNFNGSAIYMANTGISVRGYLTASELNVYNCMVGINIDWYSEYNKFTDVMINSCNHACINNGGNNVFVNCTFHGILGFLMDNSGGDKGNNSHGTCLACTFNHINSNDGYAAVVKNNTNGFIFTGCQMWYSKINIENSRGMTFSNCLFGGGTPEITVTGNYPAFFSDCIFHATPAINVVTGTKFNNCYLDSNGSIVEP